MSTESLKALDAAIRAVLQPQLAELGFQYEASSRTFRKKVGECTQIVNFQVGLRSLEGRFTVNLGVFHPDVRTDTGTSLMPQKPREFHCLARVRLAVLRDTPVTRLFRPFISKPDTSLKWWLITPSDSWWPFTADEAANSGQLTKLRGLLLTRGTSWLDARSDVAALRRAVEQVKAASPRG
jgi:hypothetical protein